MIIKKIKLVGDLTENQIEELKKESQCWTHQMLDRGIDLVSRFQIEKK